jgi:hypothetical protein
VPFPLGSILIKPCFVVFFAQKLIRNPFLYEKDNLHQHAAYPGVLPRFTTIDLGLYGLALTS